MKMSIIKILSAILGNVPNFITVEEAGRSIFKDYLKKPKKFNFYDASIQDRELEYQLDRLKTGLKDESRNCISAQEIEWLKEEYFHKYSIPMDKRNDLSKSMDDFFEDLNKYLEEQLSLEGKLIYSSVKKQEQELREINSKVEEINSKADEIKEILKDREVANSTKDFINRFRENLFWDQEEIKVRLCDVYMEPKTDKGTSILDEVEAFLKEGRETLLVIEAVAGSGKSSLMAKLATIYGDKTHYFLRLSEFSCKENIGLIKELREYLERDPAWKDYYQQGNVLFLDGFDEIASRIDYKQLQEDISRCQHRKMKLIITTRPNYILLKVFLKAHMKKSSIINLYRIIFQQHI